MATKLTFIGAAPAATTGVDVVNAGPQTPTVADQNIANLRAAVDAKAALAGSATQDFAAKTLTATTVNANNIGEITHSQGIVTTYAASGSTGIQIANNDNLNFGTGGFTLVWKGSLPDWTPAVIKAFFTKYSSGYYGVIFALQTDGKPYLMLGRGSAFTYFVSTEGVPGIANYQQTLSVTVTRETGATAGTVVFCVNGVQLGAVITIPAATTITVSNVGAQNITGDVGTRIDATTQAAYAFNRALSDAEVLSLCRYGVAESDKWGSQIEIITPQANRDFSGASNWVNGNMASFDTVGDLTVSSTASSQYCSLANAYIGLSAGFRYRITCTASSLSGAQFALVIGGTNQSIGTIITGVNKFELVVTAGFNASVTLAVSSLGTGSVTLDDFSITKVGATLALEPEGIQPAPGQWLDSSSNKLHALHPAAGSSLARKKESFEIRWTNTWAGTHEAQYISGLNQAVLPPNCYIESIIGVVSGTVIEDIILGDGVDTDRWVTITTVLATGTQTFAIANRVSDGTNRKLVVDPDANFTGSIAWVIKGIML